MKKITFLIVICLVLSSILFAKKGEDSLKILLQNRLKLEDSIEASLRWQFNTVAIANGIATLNLPKDFKYLNPEQSNYILHDLWGNPPRHNTLGMIFPSAAGPFDDSSYAFIITFEADGFVKDHDADDINYDDMLKDMQKAEAEVNKERNKDGYEAIHIIGFALKPYYDKENKVLYWAKELKFGFDSVNTLNYDVRVLGRKGILSLNAVATINELELVKANIDRVSKFPQFTAGNRYQDFNSKTDDIAAYGIGALVAGGVLAKTGVLAFIGKFLLVAWKFIAFGVIAMWGIIKKFFTGRSKT